ncbi:MAG: ABC transporter permease [Phototrophicaceae bacterium]
MFNLFKHEIRSRWRMILLWGLGLTAWGSIYIIIYPEIADQMADMGDLDIVAAVGMDIATFEGFIASVLIQIMPLILGFYVIMMATGTLAGEEEDGTLELVVAMPLKRWQVVASKTAALLIVIFLILVILGAGSALVLNYTIGENPDLTIIIEPMQLFLGLLSSYFLMVALFGMSLFFSAFMPNRRWALIVMLAIYIASYVGNSAANMVDSLDWLNNISIFSYTNTTATLFTDGPAAGDIAVLLGVGIVGFLLALWSFEGRNITVGQWIWQRNQSPA